MSDYSAARSHCALFDRSGRGKIEVAGNDAVVFLHNLSTNDIKGLASGVGCEVFFCTATAKVIAYGYAWRCAPEGKREAVWLDLSEGQAEKLCQHLDHYLISEDVTLTDRSVEMAQYHLAGPSLLQVLAGVGVTLASYAPNTFQTAGPLTVRFTEPLGLPGCDLLVPTALASSLREGVLRAGAHPASNETFEVLRIEAGTPLYGKDIDETTFAAEVGRTLQAISYTKGCFLGQEPIVMARDRGVVQRGLVGVLLGAEAAPPGTLLFRDGKEVGRITSSTKSPKLEQAIGLGYVRRASMAPGTALEAGTGDSRQPVTVTKLPFFE